MRDKEQLIGHYVELSKGYSYGKACGTLVAMNGGYWLLGKKETDIWLKDADAIEHPALKCEKCKGER